MVDIVAKANAMCGFMAESYYQSLTGWRFEEFTKFSAQLK